MIQVDLFCFETFLYTIPKHQPNVLPHTNKPARRHKLSRCIKKTDGKRRVITTTCLIRLYIARIPTLSLANSQCSNINHAEKARTDVISGHLATVLWHQPRLGCDHAPIHSKSSSPLTRHNMRSVTNLDRRVPTTVLPCPCRPQDTIQYDVNAPRIILGTQYRTNWL